jgi:FMN reductase
VSAAPADDRPLVAGLGGTTRRDSSSERALRAALEGARSAGARTLVLAAADLQLPLYAPERESRTPEAVRLVEALAAADGLIIASPGYHGGPSGLIKNALDYAEDLRDRARPYLEGVPVGCIVCADGWQATATTLMALRSVVHALRGWPTPLGVTINSSVTPVDDSRVLAQLRLVGRQVAEFAAAGGVGARLSHSTTRCRSR